MTTISDVAKYAGVSISTVSNVINQNGKVKKETEQIVLDAIKQLNYIPNQMARGLKRSQTNIIGVIAEEVNTPLASNIIEGICSYAESSGYIIHLCNLRINTKVDAPKDSNYSLLEASEDFQKSVRTNLNTLLSSQISVLIYLGTYPRDVANILPSLDIPVVYAYAYHSGSHTYAVNYDDFQGGEIATEYLISKGHQRIGLISGSINSYPTHRRMLGYQTALMNHQLAFIPECICTGDWKYESGYEQCLRLLELSQPPTAIFAMSDMMAYGAMNAVRSRGLRIPEDISIIGFDNLEFSACTWPPLTTVRLPFQEIGQTACQTAVTLLKGESPAEYARYLPCNLIERDSVSSCSTKK